MSDGEGFDECKIVQGWDSRKVLSLGNFLLRQILKL